MSRGSLVVVVSLGLLLAACQGTDPGAGEDVEVTTPAPTPTPNAGGDGTLVVAISSDPGHLNPAITTSGGTHTASELLYSGLVALDEGGEPVPQLATDWDIEDDGALYRFHLRDDVVWHDGEPFTADDVVFTFEQALLELHARTSASLSPNLASVEAVDDHTVEFQMTRPYAPLLLQLNVTEAPILPEHVFGDGAALEEHPANTDPVGTGPFSFVSYEEGSEIRLERHEEYFEDDLPHLDEVVMRVIPDEATQVLALENGEVDFLWGVSGPDLVRLRDDPTTELGSTASNPGGANCIMTVAFNLERPILASLQVRQAIAHAFDRQQFLDQILFGEGAVAQAPISSGISWAHAPDTELPTFDRDEAQRLLEEAGWVDEGGDARVAQGVEGVDDGTTLTIDFVHFPTFESYGDLVREQLGAVGIEVGLRPLEPPVFAPTVFAEDDFDTNVISYCNGPDPEIGVRRMYDSDQIGDVPFTNAAQYSNDEVDELFDEAVETIDQDARGALYGQIQQRVAEDLPYVWLVETVGTRAWTADCEGFMPWTGLFAESASCDR